MKLFAFRKVSWWPLIMLVFAAMMALAPAVLADELPDETCPPGYHWEPSFSWRYGGESGTEGPADLADGTTFGVVRIDGDLEGMGNLDIPPGGFPDMRFTMIEGHIFVPVTINGKVTRWLVLDTGADFSILNSAAIRDSGLKGAGARVIHSKLHLSKVRGFPFSAGFIPSVQLYSTDQSRSHVLFVGPMNSFFAMFGFAADGLLGLDGMPGEELLIDFEAQRVSFPSQPVTTEKLRTLGLSTEHSLALTLWDSHSTDLDIQVDGKYSDEFTKASDQFHAMSGVTILVDGKPHTLELDTGSNDTIVTVSSAAAEQKNPALRSGSLYGDLALDSLPAASVGVAGWTLPGQTVYSRLPAPGSTVFPPVMGMDLLSQFQRVLIDFAGKRIYFGQPIWQMAKPPEPKE